MVDLIRSGKAPEVIRRKGAEGNLPLPLEDKIEILALIATVSDEGLREVALETFQRWDGGELRRLLASPQTTPAVLCFAAQQVLAGREDLRETLLWNPSLPAEFRDRLQLAPDLQAAEAEAAPALLPQTEPLPPLPAPQAAQDSPGPPEPDLDPASPADEAGIQLLAKLAAGEQVDGVETPAEVTKRDDELTTEERQTLIQKVGRMTVVEKIKAALTGNLETRSLLIRDSNKIISRAVLQSPKISETEAESYAAAKNVSEEVLRLISMNRRFMKSYVVTRALANNPRAPIDVSLPLIRRMNDRDLKGLSLNRNVPDVIRSMAIKAIKQKEEASKPKLLKH